MDYCKVDGRLLTDLDSVDHSLACWLSAQFEWVSWRMNLMLL